MMLLKKSGFILSRFLLVWIGGFTSAYAEPLLVLDMRNAPQLPKHFRTTLSPLQANVNETGLASLHMAGSGQFSKQALQKILNRLNTRQLTIIDLRQESHGFLNGNAISWYGFRNAANANKTSLQIEEDQARLIEKLNQEDYATVVMILDKAANGRISKTKLVEFSVHGVSSEADLAKHLHLAYERLYVQDFHAPSDKEVDHFLAIVKQLPDNQWIYFHCRAGIGRTTLFMAMYDMLHNAKKVSFQEIMARQAALGGKDLSVLPNATQFKYQSAVQRLNFLKKFYQYTQENADDFQTSYTQWKRG